ncbi:MAG: AAA family ATPase [Candidatus Micrarchaeota archaeon]
MRLLITGTPCTGKTVLAKQIAILLKANFVDVNKLILDKKLFVKKKGEREKTVKLALLAKELKKILSKEKNVVVESHLLCEMRLPCDKIFVLRCEPKVLEKRLKKRKYPEWKIKENVLAETLDYCLVKTEENYSERAILQVDNTVFLTAKSLLARKKQDSVNWMDSLAPSRYI